VCFALILGVICRSKIRNWICGTRENDIPEDRKTIYEMSHLDQDRTIAQQPLQKGIDSSDIEIP
jgi:hypothetical protein